MDQELRQRDAGGAPAPVRASRAGLRAELRPRDLAQEIIVVILAALALASLQAFRVLTETGWHERLAYWLRTVAVGYLLYRLIIWRAALAARRLDYPEWAGWSVAVMMAGLPFALWLWWMGPVVDLSRSPPALPDFLDTYGQALIPAAMAFGVLWLLRAPAAAEEGSATEAGEVGAPQTATPFPRLVGRLPPQLRSDLIAISVEDHYVRVFTRVGNALLLMRLSDAIAETEPLDGVQIHRSWWVARSAIKHLRRHGRTGTVVLDTGLTVPVARRRLAELRQWS